MLKQQAERHKKKTDPLEIYKHSQHLLQESKHTQNMHWQQLHVNLGSKPTCLTYFSKDDWKNLPSSIEDISVSKIKPAQFIRQQ